MITTTKLDFNEQAFLHDTKHAFKVVMEMFGRNEMANLKPLLSPEVHRVFQETHADYERAHKTMSIEVVEMKSAAVVGVFMAVDEDMPDDLVEQRKSSADSTSSSPDVEEEEEEEEQEEISRKFWSQLDSLSKTSENFPASLRRYLFASGGAWLIVKVRFVSVETCTISDTPTGQVVVTEDRRGHTWEFSRYVYRSKPFRFNWLREAPDPYARGESWVVTHIG